MKHASLISISIACVLLFAIITSVSLAQRPSRGGGIIIPPPQPIPVPAISPR